MIGRPRPAYHVYAVHAGRGRMGVQLRSCSSVLYLTVDWICPRNLHVCASVRSPAPLPYHPRHRTRLGRPSYLTLCTMHMGQSIDWKNLGSHRGPARPPIPTGRARHDKQGLLLWGRHRRKEEKKTCQPALLSGLQQGGGGQGQDGAQLADCGQSSREDFP